MLVRSLGHGTPFLCPTRAPEIRTGTRPADAACSGAVEPSDPHRSPNWTFAIATVIWAITVGIAARITMVALAPLIGGAAMLPWLQSTPLGLSTSAAVLQLAMAAVVIARGNLLPNFWRTVYEDCRRRKSQAGWALLLILGIGPVANACGVLVAKVTGSDLRGMQYVADLIRRASLTELIVMGLVLTVLPAVIEESLFRGVVQRSLAGGRVMVVLGSQAVAFGCFHLDVAQGVATAILGLGFGFIAYHTGSLVGAMVAHGGYNLMVLLSQRYAGSTVEATKWQLLELTVGVVLAAWASRHLSSPRVTEGTQPA